MSLPKVLWRFDLDYVPWDTADGREFGHGEPAMVLRLLQLARERGLRFQFFASTRVLRAFPSLAESVLNEGHALDWLCKHPNRHAQASELFGQIGHRFRGVALVRPALIQTLPCDFVVSHWPVETAGTLISQPLDELRDALHAGITYRQWIDEARAEMLEHDFTVIAARPQVLARVDSKLAAFEELFRTSHTPVVASDLVHSDS